MRHEPQAAPLEVRVDLAVVRIKLGHSSSSYSIGASLQKQMPFIFNKLRWIALNWSDCK